MGLEFELETAQLGDDAYDVGFIDSTALLGPAAESAAGSASPR
jgi:hypothetical protein